MSVPQKTAALDRLTKALVDLQNPALRGQLLVETIVASGVADAAALLRRRPDGEFLFVVRRGEESSLPLLSQVEAVVDGALPRNLPHRRLVVDAGAGLALALGGVETDDPAVDGIEALLVVYAAIAAIEPGPAGLEEVAAPGASTTELVSAELGRHLAKELRAPVRRRGLPNGSPAFDAIAYAAGLEAAACRTAGIELRLNFQSETEQFTANLQPDMLEDHISACIQRLREAVVDGPGVVNVEVATSCFPRPGLRLLMEREGKRLPGFVSDSFEPRLAIAALKLSGAIVRQSAPARGGLRFETWIPKAT